MRCRAVVGWKKYQVLFLISALFLFSHGVRADLWSTAYYPGWVQGSLAASNVDYTALSHVIHFSSVPNADGSLNNSVNSLTVGNSTDVVTRAHAAGRKVLFCVGGAGSQSGFQGATSAANLSKFVTNLVNLMIARGYDGIDLDWEPLPSTDFAQFTNLVNSLRTQLNGFTPPKLLTAAIGAYPPWGDSPTAQYTMLAALQAKFDQINVMTYDLSGAYDGWVTWFNAPISNGGFHFPSTGGLVPSTDEAVSKFVAGGVAPGKLGIGIAFYGYVWSGGSGTSTGGAALPRQTWTTAPTSDGNYTFDTIMTTYYQSNRYHWDTNAQAAYLSIDNGGSANDKFISYDDEHTCQAKVSYARNRGLGGVMIWELGSGYRPALPTGSRDPLLQAVKQALATPRITGTLELQAFAGTNRVVRFILSAVSGGTTNYLQTNDWTFTNATPTYSLQVPTNTTHISAKTAWNLRRRQAVSPFVAGVATVNFTNTTNLKGGDFITVAVPPGMIEDTDNIVTSSDYLLLLGHFLQTVGGSAAIGRADIDGDGVITASDYLLLLGNYLISGDAP